MSFRKQLCLLMFSAGALSGLTLLDAYGQSGGPDNPAATPTPGAVPPFPEKPAVLLAFKENTAVNLAS
jgi:hypothetical protein